MKTRTRPVFCIVLASFFLSLGFTATLTTPVQAAQTAQSDEQKPKPKPTEEEEHNDEDDC